MDADIKNHAEALYEAKRKSSADRLRAERADTLSRNAARNTGNLPLSGTEIQVMIGLYVADIERCMTAKLESYWKAYAKAGRTPSQDDFTAIMGDFKAAQELGVQHASKAVEQFIKSRGGPPPLPEGYIESSLRNGSAHAHDEVLGKWKIWRTETELKPAEASSQIKEKRMDSLLPIYDRSEFDSDLADLLSKSTATSPVSLVFMDLDEFKSINDGPGGHTAGDRALKAFAGAALKVSVGKGSAYRFGGDEVCVLLPNHSLGEAVAVAERIRREVSRIEISELSKCLSSSLGVACCPESTADPNELLSLADAAMYESKKAGGNLVSKARSMSATEPASSLDVWKRL